MFIVSFVLTGRDFKHSVLTWVFIGTNIFLFLLLNIVLDYFLGYQTVYFFAQNNMEIRSGVHIWSIFTSIFVHSDFMHLIFNQIALLLFGMMNEKYYTKFQWLIIYIGSGLLGSLASLLLYPPNTIGLGASGAIYGLMAAVIIYIPRDNLRLMIYGGIYVLLSLRPPTNFAHLFGMLAGFLIGLYIKRHPKNLTRRKKPKIRWRFSLWLATLRDRRFFSREKRLAKKLNFDGEESYPSKHPQEQDPHVKEINLLRRFHSRMNYSLTASFDQLAQVLELDLPALTKKLLVWHQKIPFHMLNKTIKIENIHQFNATLDEIFFAWEEEHPST